MPTLGKSADFLVVSGRPVRLARVFGGQIADDEPQGWIGDHEAFQAFQHHFHGRHDPAKVDPQQPARTLLRQVSAAFQDVVDGPVVSVGEASIVITTSEDGALRYQDSAIAYPIPQTFPRGGGPVRFGSAEEGGFAYTILRPRTPGPGAIGVYFAQGRLGLFYHPLKSRDAFPYPNVSQDEFEKAVQSDHDFGIKGFLKIV